MMGLPPPPVPRKDEEKRTGRRAAGDRIRQSTTRRGPRRKEGVTRWDGDVRRRRVDETKAAADEHTEGETVAKGGDDRELGEGVGGVGDSKIGTEEGDEAVDDDVLGPKTMEQLVPRRGATATKTGGEAPNRRGRRTRPVTAPRRGRRGSLDFFFFYTRSAREEGNVDNAVRDGGGGISMVHRCGLKNLLMVKVRALELLKLRTARKPDQGQTNTPHPCVPD